jgi:hypothetical protein
MDKTRLITQFLPKIHEVIHTMNIDLEPLMVAAVIIQESAGFTCAMRHEPTWRYSYPTVDMMAFAENIGSTVETEKMGQKTSWGLMQVMGTVAREHGFTGWFTELCDPLEGIKYGMKHLQSKRIRYGTMAEAISAYNAGSPRKTSGGMFHNQKYVDSVMRHYQDLNSGL